MQAIEKNGKQNKKASNRGFGIHRKLTTW